MNQRELKRRLRAEADETVPDVRARVLTAAELPAASPKPKRRGKTFAALAAGLAAVAACLAIALPLSLRGGKVPPGADTTAVYLKINPAVELTVRDGLVAAARPLNRDGVILLEKQTLVNRPVEDACADLAAEAQKTEYLTAGKSITVCVSGREEKEVLAKVKISLAPYRVDVGQSAEALQQKADRYGIGTGKMQLIELLLGKDASLDEEKLVRKDTEDLMEMLEDYDEDELEAFRGDFEREYAAAFGDFAKSLKKMLVDYQADVKALIRLAEKNDVENLQAQIAAVNQKYAKLGQKYAIPSPDDDWDDFIEELEEYLEEAEETLEDLKDDPEDVYEDLFEESFEDWLDGFKISMKK